MIHVAVIGCGIIGARHVQALGRLQRGAQIYAVDSSAEALERARTYFSEEQGGGVNLKLLSSLEELPEKLDVAVVATGARHRLQVVKALLNARCVRHLILEKFLFQRSADYSDIEALLKDRGVSAWVNCPRRVWPGYAELRGLATEQPLGLAVTTGSRFGVATSAIHFLDLFDHLGGRADDLRFDPSGMSTGFLPHRSGGIDFSGTLQAVSGDGSFFRYTAFQCADDVPAIVTIETPSGRMIVDEGKGIVRLSWKREGWAWKEAPIEVIPQSRITHHIVEDLIETDGCDLVGYSVSARLHLMLLDAFLRHVRRIGDAEAMHCDIT